MIHQDFKTLDIGRRQLKTNPITHRQMDPTEASNRRLENETQDFSKLKKLGKDLLTRRLCLRKTQSEVACMLCVKPDVVRDLESGKFHTTSQTLINKIKRFSKHE